MLKFKNGQWIFYNPGICFAEDPDDGLTISMDNPEVQRLVTEQVEEQVKGLKKKNDELLGKLAAQRDSVKSLQTQMENLGGEEGIKNLMAMQDQIAKDEDLKLFASGDRKAYDERIIGRLRQDLESQLRQKDKALKERDDALSKSNQKLNSVIIEGRIRDVAMKSGMRPSAIPDAIRRGRELFQLNEEGNPVARVGESIVHGKDGEPLTIEEYIPSLRQGEAPHYWDNPSGSGSDPNQRSSSNSGEAGIIDINDQQALNQNIEGLASGKVKVGRTEQ